MFKLPPKRLKAGDELVVAWLNSIRDAAVEGSISHLGVGLKGSPTPNGWSIGLDVVFGGVFFCQTPSTSSWGATGSWPNLTAGSFTADVYQANGSKLALATTAATIYNWFPSTPANSKIALVLPDGSGAYVVVSQSCT